MRILVTGGTGFTGSALVRRLVERGHDVRSLDTQKGLFHEELSTAGAELRIGSVADADAVEAAVEGCEIVYHLAAAFRRIRDPREHYWDVNVEGTRRLLEASQRHGVRKFVYCSTQGVHGHVADPPGDEESPIAPADYYQYTKHEGEKVVNEFVERGLDAMTIRPTAIYGPGDPGRFLILFRLAKRGRFTMFGDGRTTYHPVHIENLTDAFERAIEVDGLQGRAYLIGDEKYFTLDDLVRHVGDAMDVDVRIRHLPFRPLWLAAAACELACKPFPVTPPLFRRRVDWFRQMRAFRIDKAVAELGYRPRVGIREGMAETAEWYRKNGYL